MNISRKTNRPWIASVIISTGFWRFSFEVLLLSLSIFLRKLKEMQANVEVFSHVSSSTDLDWTKALESELSRRQYEACKLLNNSPGNSLGQL